MAPHPNSTFPNPFLRTSRPPLPPVSSATGDQRSAVSAGRESTGSNNTYVMSGSPLKHGRKRQHEPYLPKITTTVGQRPACLINASVTYVGNDQIFAFGGFDQYTDEGMIRAAIR